jgi:hypothetical protein
MAGQIDLAQLRQDLLLSDEVMIAARQEAVKMLEQQKEALISEFNDNPVTQEIEAGPEASNKSGTLGGRGNLFSFIGFDDADNPVAPVRQLLNTISLASSNGKPISQDVIEFSVEIPSRDDFESVSKMPWENGRSWLFEVERAISGLGHYIYGRFKQSRSGTGAQADAMISPLAFSPVPYFETMLKKFKRNLK